MRRVQHHLKRLVRQAMHYIDSLLICAGANSRMLAAFYYLIRGKFSREQQAVLAGKLAYRKSLRDPSINSSLLRRNIHRLEKGLLMRPRRVPFGLNYIAETVDTYIKATRSGIEKVELAWAHDVLNEYMRVTPEDPTVEPLRMAIREIPRPLVQDTNKFRQLSPYTRRDIDAPNISYDEFLKLARFRRSVRWFLTDRVPRAAIERAIEAASYSPTACNRQPYEYRIFDEPELVSQVISLPMGTAGFSHQVPAVAVVVGKQRNYPNERDRHLIYLDGALSIMSFIYALEVQGLASCCVNWPDIEALERKMEVFLNLEADERPIMLVAFGYPDPSGLVADSTKKSIPTLCKYNFESR